MEGKRNQKEKETKGFSDKLSYKKSWDKIVNMVISAGKRLEHLKHFQYAM